MGKSRKKIAELISQSANETGASRVIKLIALLELMATSEEYEILASTGFTETVNSDDFERFNKVYKYLVKNFTSPVKLEEVAALVGLTPTAFVVISRNGPRRLSWST